jgi:hypothetical protein
VAGPTPERIEHYIGMLQRLGGVSSFGESMCWTVIRPHQTPLTVADALRRLGGDPDTITTCPPVDVGYDDEAVFLEQRDGAVILVGYHPGNDEPEVLRRLSRDATVHEVFWVINNFNRLYYAVDGVVVTELDVLSPGDRWGTDPEALTGHLGALLELRARERGPWPDWETAMATVESLTGVELDADWFGRPQLFARINRR